MLLPSLPIQVIDLLRQREMEFVRIWQCEQELKKILTDFPIPAPPDLPSRHKPRRPSAAAAKAGKNPAAATRLRELQPGENAYKVLFVYQGKEESSLQLDRKALENLLPLQTSDFQLTAIQTVQFETLEKITVIDTIWKAEEACQ